MRHMKRLLKHHKWILSLLLVALIGVGATSAYLIASSGTVKNTFASGNVDTEIDEDLSNDNKIVKIENKGELPAYVRARIVVGGANADKVVYTAEEPATAELAESDQVYVILANQSDWAQATGETGHNDWYYYLKPLDSSEKTSALMTRVMVGGKAQIDEAHFTVTITQEAVVIGNDARSTADEIKTEFGKR